MELINLLKHDKGTRVWVARIHGSRSSGVGLSMRTINLGYGVRDGNKASIQ